MYNLKNYDNASQPSTECNFEDWSVCNRALSFRVLQKMELTPHSEKKNKLMKGQHTQPWEELVDQTRLVKA